MTNAIAGDTELTATTPPTFVYLRVTTGSTPILQVPLAGASVQLYELDNPAPAGDDVQIPATGDSEKITPKFDITDSKTYEPLPDQLLGTGVTDATGFVQFSAVPNSFGGIFTDIKTTSDVKTGEVISSTTTTRKIVETKADFGVTITAANGSVIARRKLIGLNVPGKHLGTAENPLLIRILTSIVVGA